MMEIYNENMELIDSPDLTLGYFTDSVRTVHHDAVEGVQEVWHYETVAEYPNGGRDVKRVVDVPGVAAREACDEEIPIRIYHPYTPEELAKMEEQRSEPTDTELLLETAADHEYRLCLMELGVSEDDL